MLTLTPSVCKHKGDKKNLALTYSVAPHSDGAWFWKNQNHRSSALKVKSNFVGALLSHKVF